MVSIVFVVFQIWQFFTEAQSPLWRFRKKPNLIVTPHLEVAAVHTDNF
jgi:hypothetical protein